MHSQPTLRTVDSGNLTLKDEHPMSDDDNDNRDDNIESL